MESAHILEKDMAYKKVWVDFSDDHSINSLLFQVIFLPKKRGSRRNVIFRDSNNY